MPPRGTASTLKWCCRCTGTLEVIAAVPGRLQLSSMMGGSVRWPCLAITTLAVLICTGLAWQWRELNTADEQLKILAAAAEVESQGVAARHLQKTVGLKQVKKELRTQAIQRPATQPPALSSEQEQEQDDPDNFALHPEKHPNWWADQAFGRFPEQGQDVYQAVMSVEVPHRKDKYDEIVAAGGVTAARHTEKTEGSVIPARMKSCVCEQFQAFDNCGDWSRMQDRCKLNELFGIDPLVHAALRTESATGKCTWAQCNGKVHTSQSAQVSLVDPSTSPFHKECFEKTSFNPFDLDPLDSYNGHAEADQTIALLEDDIPYVVSITKLKTDCPDFFKANLLNTKKAQRSSIKALPALREHPVVLIEGVEPKCAEWCEANGIIHISLEPTELER